MNKLIISIVIVAVIAIGISGFFVFQKPAFPQPLTPPATKEQLSTFLMIHFEVGGADFPWYKEIALGADNRNLKYQEALWPTAVKLVDLANSYGFKLTLCFTPQWAEYILKDNEKIEIVKKWQKEGHEITYHHHGIDHPDWDGYSNRSEAKLKEGYRGTAAEGFEFLKKLAYPENVIVGTITDAAIDLPNDIKILTCGGGQYGSGHLADTVSEPESRKKGDKETIWLGHGFLESFFHNNKKTNDLLVELKEKYEELLPNKVFGIVTHCHDFYRYPDALEKWVRYVNLKGDKIQTVKEITEQLQAKPLMSEQSLKTIKSQEQISKNSPFGIFGPFEWKLDSPDIASVNDINNYLKDLGIKWIQEMHFTKELKDVPGGINIYSRIGREGGNKPPNTTEQYKEKLRKVIQQYKDKIKYWEVSTEPSGFPPPNGWQGYAEEYANHYLKVTYEIIKQESPDSYVVFGGMSGVGTGFSEKGSHAKHTQFLRDVLQAGGGKYFDVFEFKQHVANANDYGEFKNKMEVYGKILVDYGIDIKKIPVFVETATHDGSPSLRVKLSPQSEAQQAVGLLKYYVFGLSQGIDKIFWNLVIERHNFGNSPTNPFNFYGLVNNPANDGQFHKKLSYFTYKKMVEILEGSDWNNIQTVQESDGVYIYKFSKEGKSIWAAWNDNAGKTQITISGIISNRVKITEAVPKYETGKEVNNYSTAFNTETKSASDGKLTITLSDRPVFVEDK